MNKTGFPAITNVSLTVDKAMANGWPTSTTYVYWGQIYLDGSAYRFGESIDDEAMLKINGTTVFNNTTWNAASFGTVELEAGWYDFELRMFNRSSGGGPNSYGGFSTTKGFGYTKGTRADMDALNSGATFVIPTDPGDRSFLRYDNGLGFEDLITISALPSDLSEVSPAYGITNGIVSGDTIVFSAPDEVVLDNGVVVSTGCHIYDVDIETDVKTELEDSPFVGEVIDGRRTFTYTHGDTMRSAVWEWLWTKVDVDAVCEPSYAGTITGSGEGYDTSKEITLTATAKEGSVFVRWEGNVPEGVSASDAKITFMPSEPISLRAIFSNCHHVTPDAPAVGAGNTWSAPTSLTNAIAKAVAGDTILLKEGIYYLSEETVIEDASLVIVGSFAGTDDSKKGAPSVFMPDSGVKSRLFKITDSSIDFTDVVFTGGNVGSGNAVYSTDSDLSFTKCVMSNNVYSASVVRGGAIYASGGSLSINKSLFAHNSIKVAGDTTYGGAIYAKNVNPTLIDDTTIMTNSLANSVYNSRGGALAFEGGSAVIRNSTFEGNFIKRNDNRIDWRMGLGGTIYAKGMTRLEFEDTKFLGGFNNYLGQIENTSMHAGLMHLEGADQVVTMNRCVVNGAGIRASASTPDNGSIAIESGTLAMTNVVVSGGKGPIIEIADNSSAKLYVENCTLTGATSSYYKNSGNYGCINGYAIHHNGAGSSYVNNTIFADNENGCIFVRETSTSVITYSMTQEPMEGAGNIEGDPLFTDAKYCHLASEAGTYTNGWFDGGEWIYTKVTSPAIDKAYDKTPYANELQPNNYRANLGAYGNTDVAAKSVLGDDPVIKDALRVFAYPVKPTDTSVTISGDIGPYGKSAVVTVYMTTLANKDSDVETWSKYSVNGGNAVEPWTKFEVTIDGLSGSYCYRIKAEGGGEVAWTSPIEEFDLVKKATLSDIHAYAIMRKQATIAGVMGDNGGYDTVVSIAYWRDGDETETTVEANYNLPIATGEDFTVVLTSLEPGVKYNYRATAVNTAGPASWTGTFTTVSSDPKGWYVATMPAGEEDGSSFENPTTIQEAIANAGYEGDVLYLKAGAYIMDQQLAISSQKMAIKGGYVGTADMAKSGETIFTRTSDATIRFYHLTSSTVVFEDITFTGGNIGSGNAVHMTDSNVTFDNCVLSNNQYSATVARGGAIYAKEGTLTINDSTFTRNCLGAQGDTTYGGALYAEDVDPLLIDNTTFATNWIYNKQYASRGGALSLIGGSAIIRNSTFAGNYIERSNNYPDWRLGLGGTIFAQKMSKLEFADTKFIRGFSNFIGQGINSSMNAGLMYLDGSDQVVSMNRCVINGVGIRTSANIADNGSIALVSGVLAMTNVVASEGRGPILEVGNNSEAELYLENCTLTGATCSYYKNSKGYGCTNGYAIVHNGAGKSYVNNTILAGNENGDILTRDTTTSVVSYSMTQKPMEGDGNIFGDPKLYDAKYCHLRSHAGVYTGDWFGDNGTWIRTRKNNSPAIDAGDPDSDRLNEPRPRGPRINMGAYGNTSKASMSWKSLPTLMILQ